MSTHRRSPPCQKALALPDWPKADRETWQAAQETAGVLDDGGAASHLNALTRQDLTRRYAYFLSFLARQGKLDRRGTCGRHGDRGEHPALSALLGSSTSVR